MKLRYITKISLFAFFFTLLSSFSSLADDRLIDARLGVGLPSLLGFDLELSKLHPLHLGFGFGMLPVDAMAKSFLKFDPAKYTQHVSGYTITPSVSLSWSSFVAFAEYFLDPIFYVHAFYATWQIYGTLSVDVTGGLLNNSHLNVGSVDLNLYQPFFGTGCGWRWDLGEHYFFDVAVGLMKFLSPSASASLHTIADAYSSALPTDTTSQLDQAHQLLNQEVSKFFQTYKSSLTYAPMFSIGIGRRI